jgi:hypothetical protein
MIATIVYAINPNDKTPKELFTSFSESDEKALQRRDQLQRDINTEGWKNWSGQGRVDAVGDAKEKGYEIRVRLCMVDD